MTNSMQKSRHPVADGILGGLAAGSVFIVAEMCMNAALHKPVLGPLRMIASIVLGQEALTPAFPLATAVVVGLLVHILLSALFGVIFVSLASIRRLGPARPVLIAHGFVYGLVLWLVNFYLIAPMAFPQFSAVNPFWNGFIAHTIFFGAVLGWYTAIARTGAIKLEEMEPEQLRRYG